MLKQGQANPREASLGLEEKMAIIWQDRLTVNPEIHVGKPIVKGTRLAVEFILELLGQGWTEADVLKNYPGLTHEDILACLAYASEVLRSEKTYSLPTR